MRFGLKTGVQPGNLCFLEYQRSIAGSKLMFEVVVLLYAPMVMTFILDENWWVSWRYYTHSNELSLVAVCVIICG